MCYNYQCQYVTSRRAKYSVELMRIFNASADAELTTVGCGLSVEREVYGTESSHNEEQFTRLHLFFILRGADFQYVKCFNVTQNNIETAVQRNGQKSTQRPHSCSK